MRRLSPLLTPLLVLVALLFAPRPARACTEHPSGARAAMAAMVAPAPGSSVSHRATEARVPAPSECCAGAAGCDAPMPCCIAAPGAIPPVLAATQPPAEPRVDAARSGPAPNRIAPDHAALPPEPPPPRA